MEAQAQAQAQALPPGYRFHPTDEELLCRYLRKKVSGSLSLARSAIIPECDLYGEKEPWEIWDEYGGQQLQKDAKEDLYFFTRLKKKSARGCRKDRRVGSGTWQGQDKGVQAKSRRTDEIVALIKRFHYENPKSSQNGRWIMHEYSIIGNDEIVLCRLRKNPEKADHNNHREPRTQPECSSSSSYGFRQ